MNTHASTFRKSCKREFTETIREVLYNQALTWGAKCLYFAILDSPATKAPKNAILARRLHCHPTQISVWFKELVHHKLIIPE